MTPGIRQGETGFGAVAAADLEAAAQVLNDGLKKIAVRIRSTFLLFLDMTMNRGDAAKANTKATPAP